MLLIAEIVLTISAWRKGWKAWALLPVAIGMCAAFMVGLSAGASGGTADDILVICVLIDLAMIASLIVMTVKAPASKPNASQPVEEIELQSKAA